MLLFDSHLDLGLNGVDWNRDLRMTVSDIRVQEITLGMTDPGRRTNTVSFPELKRAEVGLGVATVLARQERQINHPFGYTTPEACYAVAMSHLYYYRAMERAGFMRPIRTKRDLQQHVADWKASPTDTPFGYILSMEGADPILSPADAARWWEAGLRVVGLSHYGQGIYAGGTTATSGLTAKGFELLAAFQELGMVVDVTHLADEGFWQVTEKYQGNILSSHNNCRALVPGQRQFSDDQIKKLIERGTVIGAAFDSWMLHAGYVQGETDNSQVKLKNVIDHIDHICQLAGNVRHVAIGSDLDGGFGKEQSPSDLETIRDLQKIPLLLKEKGYSQDDISGIMHGNWLRFFQHALPAR